MTAAHDFTADLEEQLTLGFQLLGLVGPESQPADQPGKGEHHDESEDGGQPQM